MALRPVPGVIGNGAENSVELMRAGFYAGTSGATGIVEPTDFKVTALPTPGAAVRVRLGTGIIKSTYPGVFGQSYVVQEQDFTDVPVAATGSAGGATKYVYVVIQDEQYGGPAPESVEDGPYNFYEVSAVLPQFQPYLLLAKIVQPASTATITGAMITDMRTVANPRKDYGIYARPRIMADDTNQVKLTARYASGSNSSVGEFFPGGSGIPNQGVLFIPDWATHMVISAKWMNVTYNGGKDSFGRYWIEYGDEYKAHTWPDGRQYEFSTQQFGFDSSMAPSTYSTNWLVDDAVPVPKKLRGKDVTFCFKAGLSANASTAGVQMKALGGVSVRADYVQQREDPDTI